MIAKIKTSRRNPREVRPAKIANGRGTSRLKWKTSMPDRSHTAQSVRKGTDSCIVFYITKLLNVFFFFVFVFDIQQEASSRFRSVYSRLDSS